MPPDFAGGTSPLQAIIFTQQVFWVAAQLEIAPSELYLFVDLTCAGAPNHNTANRISAGRFYETDKNKFAFLLVFWDSW